MASATGVSRRRFLTGIGISAAGVATPRPAEALAQVISEAAGGTARASDKLGRIFTLPPFADLNAPSRRPALTAMGQRGGVLDARDPRTVGPVRLVTEPGPSPNNQDNQDKPANTAGVTVMGQFLGHDMTFDETSRLGVPLDPLPAPNTRTPDVDLDSVYGAGPTGSPRLYAVGDRDQFRVDDEAARRLVRWHYQWMVPHEFPPLFVGQAVVNDVLRNDRRIYRSAAGQQFVPVEFQGAAHRFGHSMVRSSPGANPAGRPRRRPHRRGRAEQAVRHRHLHTAVQPATAGDPLRATADLAALAEPAAPCHVVDPVRAGDRQGHRHPTAVRGERPRAATVRARPAQRNPAVVLRAAGSRTGRRHPARRGRARIVAEVSVGLLQLDPTSCLASNPNWVPTLPRRSGPAGDFRMADMLTFTRVDPDSRGQ